MLSSTTLQLGMGAEPPGEEENWCLEISSGDTLLKKSCRAAAYINISVSRSLHEVNFPAWLFSSAAVPVSRLLRHSRGENIWIPRQLKLCLSWCSSGQVLFLDTSWLLPSVRSAGGGWWEHCLGCRMFPAWVVIGWECGFRAHLRAAGDFSALILSGSFLKCVFFFFSRLGLVSWI